MEHTSNEKLAEALKLLEEAAKDKKDELKSTLSDKYTHLKNVIVETEQDLAESLSDVGKRTLKAAAYAKNVGVKQASELAHDVDKNVHRNPWPYIAGAASVGLLLGYILGRNRD